MAEELLELLVEFADYCDTTPLGGINETGAVSRPYDLIQFAKWLKHKKSGLKAKGAEK